jgi:hypothetical protein
MACFQAASHLLRSVPWLKKATSILFKDLANELPSHDLCQFLLYGKTHCSHIKVFNIVNFVVKRAVWRRRPLPKNMTFYSKQQLKRWPNFIGGFRKKVMKCPASAEVFLIVADATGHFMLPSGFFS